MNNATKRNCSSCVYYNDGHCNNKKLFCDDIAASDDDGLWVDDPSGGYCVGPHFGCIHYESNDKHVVSVGKFRLYQADNNGLFIEHESGNRIEVSEREIERFYTSRF